MSYQEALEAAGAVVHDFQEFGSFQGDWLAKVTYNGTTGFVAGYYGSCSGCDAFEGEFGYVPTTDAAYQERLAAFGREYLDGLGDGAALVARFTADLSWDGDASSVIEWLREHGAVVR